MKEGWEYKKLGEVCDVRDGTHDSPQYQITGIPLITSKNLINGKIDFSNVNYISENDAAHINKRSKVDIGDIIMPMIGTIGNPIINNSCNCFCIKNVALIKFINNFISNKFVYYLLSSEVFIDYIKKNNKGGTQKFLALGLIRELPIPVPPISEQKRIVEELDLLSGIIEKQKQQLKELDTLALSIFYDMFGDPVTNEKGWEVKNLGEIGETGSGGTPSKDINEYWDNGDIPWIGSNMCQNTFIYKTDGKYITELGLEKSSAKLLPVNTVLIALVGATIGKVGILKRESSTNQNIAFVRPNKNFNSIFLFYEVMNLYSLFQNIGDGKFKMANLKFIRNLTVIIPPLPLQNEFASKIEAIEKQKDAITRSIDETQRLFDYTMDKYFG